MRRLFVPLLALLLPVAALAQNPAITDPPRDAAHPPQPVAFVLKAPDGAGAMNALLWQAGGAGAHPTLLLFHGFPGNEQNLDLAQAARRASQVINRASHDIEHLKITAKQHNDFVTEVDKAAEAAIIETLTDGGRSLTMAQRYIPEITQGDKRILLIDGEPVPYCLARIPQGTEFRGNLAAGGRGEGRPLSDRDRWIASQVGPELKRRGMIFVGLDVIGDYLTEVNVTSPTCIRELDKQFGLNIAGQMFDAIEVRLERHS